MLQCPDHAGSRCAHETQNVRAWDSDRSAGQGPSVCCSVLITQVNAVRMGHRTFRPGPVTDQRDMVLPCPSESWPLRLTLLKQGHRTVGPSPVTGQRDMVLPCLALKPGLVSDGRVRVFPCPSTLTTPARYNRRHRTFARELVSLHHHGILLCPPAMTTYS